MADGTKDPTARIQLIERELAEARDRQAAIAEVLKSINASSGSLETIFETILQKAIDLCGAQYGVFFRCADGKFHATAFVNAPEQYRDFLTARPLELGMGTATGRAVLTGTPAHIHDLRSLEIAEDRHVRETTNRLSGARTIFSVPIIKDGQALGAITIYRTKLEPFADRSLDTVMAFADQAAIAIENARLLSETTESLRQQTATAEVLKIISRSTVDLQSVLDTLVESAARVCEAEKGVIYRREDDLYKFAARYGFSEAFEQYALDHPYTAGRSSVTARAALEARTVQIADVLADPYYGATGYQKEGDYRTALGVPLLREGEPIGVFALARTQSRPFTPKQIELVETFADQAVIAIENARLFRELQERTEDLTESLQQQTATADVLKVISRSTFDLEAVLDTLLRSATQLCAGHIAWIFQRDGENLRWMAGYGHAPEVHDRLKNFFADKVVPIDRGSIIGRTTCESAEIHLPDVLADTEYKWGEAQKIGGYRACLGLPLLREGNVVGVLFVARTEPVPFSVKQIELAKTFADQALIAIENTRLLAVLQESLDQQTATADVLSAISRTTFDLKQVMTTLLEAAARFCKADQAMIAREQAGKFRRVATFGFPEELDREIRESPIELERGTAAGRALMDRQIVHIPDVRSDPDYNFVSGLEMGGFRTVLAVPMLRGENLIGLLALIRTTPSPFTEKQIELVSNFADQAAIAIENVRLFENVEARSQELARSLEELKSTQDRLVQTEKLASLGQLTAGIAHEIKNPLNFVNNFSSVSSELIDELSEILAEAKLGESLNKEVHELVGTLRQNCEKVLQHGRRADSIVRNMLMHSRRGSGERSMTNVNALVEDSLNLAFHGARAERPGFQVALQREYDECAGEAEIFPQEISRVLLNLISNGFHAVTARKSQSDDASYEPTLSASTRDAGDHVEIGIRDNGAGVPENFRRIIFDPFFTTKPAGEGTGLGLSLSHDIVVKQHGGTINLDSEEGKFAEFRILLPRRAR